LKSYFNSIANLGGNFASIGISLLLIPLYIKYLGLEAYGLIGFFTTISAYVAVLDFGLLSSLANKMSSYKSSESSKDETVDILSSVENLFIGVLAVAALIWFFAADFLSTAWFKENSLGMDRLKIILLLMGATTLIRFFGNIFRSTLLGLCDQIYLNISTSIFSMLRGVVVVFGLYISPSILTFFLLQLLTTLLEVLFFRLRVCKILDIKWTFPDANFSTLRQFYKIGVINALCVLLWVSLTQIDKLILSKMLSLKEFGEVSISLSIVNLLPVFSASILQAFTPDLVASRGANQGQRFAEVFIKILTLTSLVMWPIVSSISAFSNEIIWAWTGSKEIQAANYLPYYAIAQCFVGLNAILYSIQFAKNDISLHFKINIFFTMGSIALLCWSTNKFGVEGASLTWLGANSLYTIFITPVIINRFVPSAKSNDIVKPLLFIPIASMMIAFIVRELLFSNGLSRVTTFLFLILSGILTIFSTWVFSSMIGIVKSPKMLLRTMLNKIYFIKPQSGKFNGH